MLAASVFGCGLRPPLVGMTAVGVLKIAQSQSTNNSNDDCGSSKMPATGLGRGADVTT
jgi:hypothetical protein